MRATGAQKCAYCKITADRYCEICRKYICGEHFKMEYQTVFRVLYSCAPCAHKGKQLSEGKEIE